jgi:hypothetical protein
MWKPGTTKPTDDDATKKPDSPPATANGAPLDSGAKKKLSGATMGMRFMQRSAQADAASKQALEQQNSDKMEWTKDGQDAGDDHAMDEDVDTETSSKRSQSASVSDMYGLKSDLIGRRSFGGFNQSAENAWRSALDAWEKGKIGDKAAKQNISDEELLRRYEDYVKGRGDMVERRVEPVGGLEKKLQKRSSHRGEKRKR